MSRCECGHLDTLHDIGTRKAVKGQRTECSSWTGNPQERCPCDTFRPLPRRMLRTCQ